MKPPPSEKTRDGLVDAMWYPPTCYRLLLHPQKRKHLPFQGGARWATLADDALRRRMLLSVIATWVPISFLYFRHCGVSLR